eukprot:6199125-Pleurochrysis_carterae.AAC.1
MYGIVHNGEIDRSREKCVRLNRNANVQPMPFRSLKSETLPAAASPSQPNPPSPPPPLSPQMPDSTQASTQASTHIFTHAKAHATAQASTRATAQASTLANGRSPRLSMAPRGCWPTFERASTTLSTAWRSRIRRHCESASRRQRRSCDARACHARAQPAARMYIQKSRERV